MPINPETTAIACGGAGYKAAFANGVLAAFETHGVRVAGYAGSSAAALPAAAAAAGNVAEHGTELWLRAMELLALPGNGMSDVLLAAIAALRPGVAPAFAPRAGVRLCIAASAVHTVAGVLETQGPRAGALGRRLLVHADRHDRSWATEHLALHLWDTGATERSRQLTFDNVADALYGGARLLHACAIPAEVDGLPYVDAIYTCAVPALELAALEFREVIAVAPEPGPVYRDLFRTSVIPEMAWRSRIRIIRPRVTPKSLGVEETVASERGLHDLYDHGLDEGLRFIADFVEAPPVPDPRFDWPKRIDPPQPAADGAEPPAAPAVPDPAETDAATEPATAEADAPDRR